MKIEKKFKLLNHDSIITKDLIIGEIYNLFKHNLKINGVLTPSWVLSIDNTSKHFTDSNLFKYFKPIDIEDNNIIGFGRIYDL